MPTMKVSAISTTSKGTGTNTPDHKNISKATKGNNGESAEDATARAGRGGTPGRAGWGERARVNILPSPARKKKS